MSDQIMGGGGVATEEPPGEAPEAPVTGSRRNLVVVGVAVVAAVAVAVWFLFLSGGGSSTPTGAVPQSSANANGAGNGTTTKPAPSKAAANPVKSAAPTHKGRNPFAPLLTVPTATPSPTAAVPASSPSASTSVPPPSPSTSSSVPAGSNIVATVSLVKVSGKTATFNVAASGSTKKYAGVAVGDTFATFFKLYDLGSKCAQIQYGDQTGPSCVGSPLVLYSAS